MARCRKFLDDFGGPVGFHGNVHEEIDIGVNVSGGHSAPRQRNQEIVAAGAGAFDAVSELVDLAAACAPDSIVPASGALDHGHEYLGDMEAAHDPRADGGAAGL